MSKEFITNRMIRGFVLLRYIIFPLLAYSIYSLLIQPYNVWHILLLFVCLFSLWGSFIESQILLVRHTVIDVGFSARIALIADLHLGPLKGEKFLRRVVRRINQLSVDYVLVAGDWTYEPRIRDLERLFKPLKDLKFPTFGVLGNHDVERPGPKLREKLVKLLESYGVRMLHNEIVPLTNFTLVGLGDHWIGEDDSRILEQIPEDQNTLVLMHNPDSIDGFPRPVSKGLSVAGHTHGGQIRIPFYKKLIPVKGNYHHGLTHEPNGKLFITSGIGETAVNVRFLRPPRIDVLELS